MVEMPDDDRQRSQDRLVKMDSQRNVDPPASEKTEQTNLEPDHQPRKAHDESAPDDRPIFRLLGITEARDLRLYSFAAERVRQVTDDIAHILKLWPHVLDPSPPVWRQRQIEQVISSSHEHDDCGDAVKHAPQIFICAK